MKKFLLIVTLGLMTMQVFAQKEHMKVLGIEINGPYDAFIDKVKARGFTYSYSEAAQGGFTESQIVWYKGKFMGEIASLCAYQSRSGNVFAVVIVLDDCHIVRQMDSEISNRWNRIIEAYDSKYLSNKVINSSYPYKIKEYWEPEMQERTLKKGDGSYYAELYSFNHPDGELKGGIRVMMQAYTKSIIIRYTDTDNITKAFDEAENEF